MQLWQYCVLAME